MTKREQRHPRYASAVLKPRALAVGSSIFWCPYCDRQWIRGGTRAEGFRKASAMRHVRACYEVQLFRAGYAFSGRSTGGQEHVVPIHRIEARERQRLMDRLRVHRKVEYQDGRETAFLQSTVAETVAPSRNSPTETEVSERSTGNSPHNDHRPFRARKTPK